MRKTILRVYRHRCDWRLGYTNLKTGGTYKNILNEEEKNKIWIPDLNFENAVEEKKVLPSTVLIYGSQFSDKKSNIFHIQLL